MNDLPGITQLARSTARIQIRIALLRVRGFTAPPHRRAKSHIPCQVLLVPAGSLILRTQTESLKGPFGNLTDFFYNQQRILVDIFQLSFPSWNHSLSLLNPIRGFIIDFYDELQEGIVGRVGVIRGAKPIHSQGITLKVVAVSPGSLASNMCSILVEILRPMLQEAKPTWVGREIEMSQSDSVSTLTSDLTIGNLVYQYITSCLLGRTGTQSFDQFSLTLKKPCVLMAPTLDVAQSNQWSYQFQFPLSWTIGASVLATQIFRWHNILLYSSKTQCSTEGISSTRSGDEA